MPIEEATYSWSATRGNYSEIVRNGLGARGIDVMERVKTGTGAGTFYSYPVYDGHGNMIATLSKNGTGFSFGNQRAFDLWGTVRMWLSGGYAGFPSGRHSAAISHQMDDESGLVYMRARYYESGSGRFISEDPAMHGGNWFAYCDSDPVNRVDGNGEASEYFFGDWYVRFDYFGGGDWHASYKGQEVLNRYFTGGVKHANKDAGEQMLAKFVEALNDAMKSGNQDALAVGKKMRANGIIGVCEHLGFAVLAITSLDAYAQANPADFADIVMTIGCFGRN